MGGEEKSKAVIVGGSIAGISCAHALIATGWEVVVIEKSAGPPTGSPTGAGLGLDPLSVRITNSWLEQPELLQQATLPLNTEQNQVIDRATKVPRTLTRDENFNFRAAHWADLRGLLYSGLPQEIFLWGHFFLSFSVSQDKTSVAVKAKALQTGDIIEINGNLLIAADGWLSCSNDFPSRTQTKVCKLTKYTGYCGWRGVLVFSANENSETILGIRKAFPELGRGLCFGLTTGSHFGIYELPRKKINWIWFVHQPQPATKATSVTMNASNDMIEDMYREAEKVWPPEFVSVIKETKDPFLNFIYDCDPLEQIFWHNVVLVGDAAHPTVPNGARSTNMSFLDAAVLGKCIQKWGKENLSPALEEYQNIRLPVTSKHVLHSRRIGRIKQGLSLPDRKLFDTETARPEECDELQLKRMPFNSDAPSILWLTNDAADRKMCSSE